MHKLFSLLILIISLSNINSSCNIDSDILSHLSLMITPEAICKEIKKMARHLDNEYRDQELVIVMILKGSLCFVADLIREMKKDIQLECIQCSSYGKLGTQQGTLTVSGIEKLDIESKHVLIVDDIADSGKTLAAVVPQIHRLNPKSVKTLVLLEKKRNNVCFHPDWSLFKIEDKFVIGYGLDYKEYSRGLKGIYFLDHHINE